MDLRDMRRDYRISGLDVADLDPIPSCSSASGLMMSRRRAAPNRTR